MNRLRRGGNARISFFSFQDIITSVTGILILITLILSFSLRTGDPQETEETRLARELQEMRERLGGIESENQQLQRRRLEAATLPDPRQLQSEVAALREEQSAIEKQKKQSEATLASARQQLERVLEQRKAAEQSRAEIDSTEVKIEELKQNLARARTNATVILALPDSEAQRSQKTPFAIVVDGERIRGQRLDGRQAVEAAAASLSSALQAFDPDRDLLVFFFRPSGVKWFESYRTAARHAGFEIGYDAVEEHKQVVFTAR